MSDIPLKKIEKCYPLREDGELNFAKIQICIEDELTPDEEIVDSTLYFKSIGLDDSVIIDQYSIAKSMYEGPKFLMSTGKKYSLGLDKFAKTLSERGIERSIIESARERSSRLLGTIYDVEYDIYDKILNPLFQLDSSTTRDFIFSILNKLSNENKEILSAGSDVLYDSICHDFDPDDIDDLDEKIGIENLSYSVQECLIDKREELSNEVVLKLLPYISEMWDEISAGKKIYFYKFDRRNQLYFESTSSLDIDELIKLSDYYDHRSVDREVIDDYIYQNLDVDADVNQVFSFEDTEEFDEWYEEEFKDADYQPKLDDARKLFMEGKVVGYNKYENYFFDYDKYIDDQLKEYSKNIEDESRKYRLGRY